MHEGISLDLAIESFSFVSLVYFIKANYRKMELRLHHIIHLYNVFRENDGKENCAQLIEEEFYKMFEKYI